MAREAVRYPGYRWVVLGIAWLLLACMSWSWFLIPSLASWLFSDLGLTHLQFTLIFTAPILASIFAAIPGGALCDRYGIRLVAAIAAFVAAVFSLARAFTPSFAGMLALMYLFGIPFGIVLPNLPKLVGIWFPPKQAGLASGIYTTALSAGSSFGLLLGPLFGGFKPAFIFIGALMLLVAVLWALLARNAPKGIEIYMPPLVSGIKKGIRSKNIWLAGMGQFLLFAGFLSFSGNLPDALERVHHISPQAAGAIASLLTWGAIIGNLLIPMLSDRVGLRRPLVSASAVISAICFFFAWQLAPGAATWVLIFLGGFAMGGITPLLLAVPLELPEIGHEYVGGASGLVISLMYMGGFLVPLVVFSPLVAAGTLAAYTTGFLVAAIFLALIVLPVTILTETGARARGSLKERPPH
jgi:nitrate/nitrite transporter NarK